MTRKQLNRLRRIWRKQGMDAAARRAAIYEAQNHA